MLRKLQTVLLRLVTQNYAMFWLLLGDSSLWASCVSLHLMRRDTVSVPDQGLANYVWPIGQIHSMNCFCMACKLRRVFTLSKRCTPATTTGRCRVCGRCASAQQSLKYLLPGPLQKTFSDFWYRAYFTKECSFYSSGTLRHWGVEKYLALTSEDLGTNSGQVTLNKFMDPPFVLVIRTSPVVQWLRIHLPIQGMRVRSLVRELRSLVLWGS